MQILKLSFTLVIVLAIDPMCQRDKNEYRRPVLRLGGCKKNLTEYCGVEKKVLKSLKFKSQLRKKEIYVYNFRHLQDTDYVLQETVLSRSVLNKNCNVRSN